MRIETEEDPSTSDGSIAGRDCLVGRIVDGVRSRGFYLTHVDSHGGQVLIDLRWAAQLAGRELGRRTRTYASAVGKRLPGMVTVIVAPVEVRPSGAVPSRDEAVIEELLRVRRSVRACRQPA